ncbi:MAG: mannose-6-phosphate isomerase, class I [Deltaproteobacteria bacterium]|nr:mannose-6-phosphate isomerase, class I [Deltaproteobacteria bacterium]
MILRSRKEPDHYQSGAGGPFMNRICLIKNEILEYPWGSETFIPELLGIKPSYNKPQAEMWMGAHKKAPSMVKIDNSLIPLNRLIAECPDDILGKSVSEKFFREMPFLFKVLSASRPLSIQAHPDKGQAQAGFKRENINLIPLDAANRNYRDDNHKPELICALTDMWALKGFREPDEIIRLCAPLEGILGKGFTHILKEKPDESGIKAFFMLLMDMEKSKAAALVNDAIKVIQPLRSKDNAYEWMHRLNIEYPCDIGVLSPLYLNVLKLAPGEAIFLAARELHAYLSGSGLEIMANSDNVLRGGLTQKHIDKDELMRILSFVPGKPQVITGNNNGRFETFYKTSSEEFILSLISLPEKDSIYKKEGERSIEIMLCTEGKATIIDTSDGNSLDIKKGMSLLIPAAVSGYYIEGKATIYKASVP